MLVILLGTIGRLTLASCLSLSATILPPPLSSRAVGALTALVEVCHGDHRPDCPILEDLAGERNV